MLLSSLLLLSLSAQVTEYSSRPAWEAVVGSQQCADFVGLASGAVVTNQYAGIGMTFTQGNDTVLLTGAFVTDGAGVNCNGDMEVVFSSPQHALGCDFPGALQVSLYSGATLVHSSSNFAGSGSGFFAGFTSTASFDRAVITDWVDGLAYVDNVCIGKGGPQLTKSGSCPGPTTISVSGVTANGNVAILFGNPGSAVKPGGICAGMVVGLSNPTLAAVLGANGSGSASLTFNAPAGACGRSLQAADLSACVTSNVITL